MHYNERALQILSIALKGTMLVLSQVTRGNKRSNYIRRAMLSKEHTNQ